MQCCSSTVAELSSGEGDYRESASVIRLPKLLIFFRCVQFALDSLGVGIGLEILQVLWTLRLVKSGQPYRLLFSTPTAAWDDNRPTYVWRVDGCAGWLFRLEKQDGFRQLNLTNL
jgi:hypothetical protein